MAFSMAATHPPSAPLNRLFIFWLKCLTDVYGKVTQLDDGGEEFCYFLIKASNRSDDAFKYLRGDKMIPHKEQGRSHLIWFGPYMVTACILTTDVRPTIFRKRPYQSEPGFGARSNSLPIVTKFFEPQLTPDPFFYP